MFESMNTQTLTLSLDEQFSALLTKNIQHSISEVLQEKFGDITLNIHLNQLNIKTLAQKETQANNGKMATLKKSFLTDEGVKKLQQVFNTTIDPKSIKEKSKTL